jgi:hypothetical protein
MKKHQWALALVYIYPTKCIGLNKCKKIYKKNYFNTGEWMSDCYLTPIKVSNMSAISWWEQVTVQWDNDVYFVLDQCI